MGAAPQPASPEQATPASEQQARAWLARLVGEWTYESGAGVPVARERDVIALAEDDDRRTFTSSVRRDDGTWHPCMTTRYRRVAGR